MNGDLLLVVLIIIGMIGRSNIITTAACVLLVVKLISLDRYLPAIERRGLELGLLFFDDGSACPLCFRENFAQGHYFRLYDLARHCRAGRGSHCNLYERQGAGAVKK